MADVRISVFIYFVFCIFLFEKSLSDVILPPKEELTKWATDLDLQLTTALERISGISVLEKSYADLKKATLLPVDGQKLVKEMAATLSSYLQKKVDALKKLKDLAEDAIAKYKYDASLSNNSVQWVNTKSFDENDPRLTYSEKFKKGVNLSYSAVHVPLEIYEGYPEILNGLKWSKVLDPIFKDNLKRDPTLMWQYFGSTWGFMRTYPAHKWTNNIQGLPDLYDVRQRSWYIHGATSPKDIMILMDTSGSMHGQTMEIMKVSVKMFLSTLGEDDFVNVAWFSKKVNLISCFETFVQANQLNKRILFQAIDKLKDGDMASLSTGLKFAFEEFDNFYNNKTEWEGAECHKIIAVFTDGGTEDVKLLLKKLNKKKKYRIFSLTVGPHPIPYASLKQMACDNKGFFTTISSMSAIRTKVQDYVKVLSQPLVLSGEKYYQWTNFYLDVASLDMLTTVTVPVFNKSDIANQSLAGVMAVDVTLQELTDKEPKYKLGPQGYTFAVNRNGLVVFHPDLPVQFQSLDELPHIDILDLEIENIDRVIVRKAMIDREVGERTVEGLIDMPDSKHVVYHKLKYHFTPIANTTFSLAVVLQPSRTHYLQMKKMDIKQSLNALQQEDESESSILLAPWKYCHGIVLQGNSTENLQNITISTRHNIKDCNEELVQHLLWDLDKTRSVLHYWQTEETERQRDAVFSTFVSTESGLTRVFPESTSSRLLNFTDPRKSLLYKRSLLSKDFVFLVPEMATYDYENETETAVTVMKTISLMDNGAHYKPAVVGVVLDLSFVQSILLELPQNPKRIKISCGQPESLLCYLLDDGGFVITTNQKDYITTAGKFLGSVDAELMDKLVNKSIYEKIEKYDSEAQCEKPRKVSAASKINFISLYNIMEGFHGILNWIFELVFCLSFWWSPTYSLGELVLKTEGMVPCTLLSTRYYFGEKPEKLKLHSTIECNDKVRHFSVAAVGQTNLILVVANHPIHCADVQIPIQQTIELDADPPSVCHPQVRYRRRPDKCFDHNPKEGTIGCRGTAAALFFPYMSLAVQVLLLTLLKFC